MTAEGEFVKASEEENADLFWGVRGGGGNFGIVTEFEFRLNPVGPTVLAGPVMWAMEDSPKVLASTGMDQGGAGRADDDSDAPPCPPSPRCPRNSTAGMS